MNILYFLIGWFLFSIVFYFVIVYPFMKSAKNGDRNIEQIKSPVSEDTGLVE